MDAVIAQRARCLGTANHEARQLIIQCSQLLQRTSQMLPVGGEPRDKADIPAECKDNLEECIRLVQRAIEIDPASPDLDFYYTLLAFATGRLGGLNSSGGLGAEQLDKAVDFGRLAIDLDPDMEPQIRANLLVRIALSLYERRQWEDSPNAMTETIRATRQAVEALRNSRLRLIMLDKLMGLLACRYGETGADQYLDEAILAGKQAAGLLVSGVRDELNSEDDKEQTSQLLGFLRELLMHRYKGRRAAEDLEEADLLAIQAAELMAHQTDLGDSGSTISADTQRDIMLADQAPDTVLSEGWNEVDAVMALLLDLLKNRIRPMDEAERYIRYLEAKREVMKNMATPAQYSFFLIILADLFHYKCWLARRREDLDRSISLTEEAADTMARQGQGNEGRELARFSLQLVVMYCNQARLGLSDNDPNAMASGGAFEKEVYTEKGIQAARQALQCTPENFPTLPSLLHDYAILLLDSSARKGPGPNLDEALVTMRKCIDMLPDNDPERVQYLESFTASLLWIQEAAGGHAILEEGLKMAREALAICNTASSNDPPAAVPPDQQFSNPVARLAFARSASSDQAIRSFILAQLLDAKSLRMEDGDGTVRDEAAHDEAIRIIEGELDGPGTTPDLAAPLLIHYLLRRYVQTKAKVYLEKLMAQLRKDLHDANLGFEERIREFQMLVAFHYSLGLEDKEELYHDGVLAVSLIPRLLPPRQASPHARHQLTNTTGIASSAAAVALDAGRGPLAALELLERGGGTMEASLEAACADFYDLQAKHSSLANRLVHLQRTGDLSASPSSYPEFGPLGNLDQGVGRLNRRRRQFEALVDETRKLPGFENFLGSPTESETLEAARDGPIAVINISPMRCDAILIRRDRLWSVPLPRLHLRDVKEKAAKRDGGGSLGRPEILEWLWDVVAGPVLGALGLDQPLPPLGRGRCLPRMWWILTGLLSRFPIHAAGYHGMMPMDCPWTVLDCVMSSYSPSIKAILDARRRRRLGIDPGLPSPPPQSSSSSTPNRIALLVAMPQTPGCSYLRHAMAEVSKVEEICTAMSLKPIPLLMPRKQDVVDLLRRGCKIFHFAGHGHSDALNPYSSHLYLRDWQEEPLRVSDLADLNLGPSSSSHGPPFLAYLSACGTGRVKHLDDKNGSPDKIVHLINAFQLAGFRHVVGTLWEVDDEKSAAVARITYESMRDAAAADHPGSDLTDESVCIALHSASRALRDAWVREGGARGLHGEIRLPPSVDTDVDKNFGKLALHDHGTGTPCTTTGPKESSTGPSLEPDHSSSSSNANANAIAIANVAGGERKIRVEELEKLEEFLHERERMMKYGWAQPSVQRFRAMQQPMRHVRVVVSHGGSSSLDSDMPLSSVPGIGIGIDMDSAHGHPGPTPAPFPVSIGDDDAAKEVLLLPANSTPHESGGGVQAQPVSSLRAVKVEDYDQDGRAENLSPAWASFVHFGP